MLNDKFIELRFLKNNIILFGYSRNPVSGIRTATSPFIKLPNLFNLVLVDKVLLLLSLNGTKFNSSGQDVKSETGYTFKKLQATGVKSVGIFCFENKLIFIPQKRIKGNFIPLNNKKSELNVGATEEDILESIKKTLTNSI